MPIDLLLNLLSLLHLPASSLQVVVPRILKSFIFTLVRGEIHPELDVGVDLLLAELGSEVRINHSNGVALDASNLVVDLGGCFLGRNVGTKGALEVGF